MQAWLDDEIARTLTPLLQVARAARDPVVPGAARGLAFQLGEHLGALDRRAAETQGPIDERARAALNALGVRFGRHTIYVPALLGDGPTRLLAILRHWTRSKPQGLLYFPKGAASTPLRPGLEWTDYVAAGLRPAGQRAVRISALERLAGRLSEAARAENRNDFALGAQEVSALQISLSDAAAMLSALGYRKVSAETPEAPARWRFPTPRTARKGATVLRKDTPFGALASMAESPEQSGPATSLRRRRRRRRSTSPGETAP
jgi:ATP-dependent RNA helicase SUPV3L1/SUV3